MAGIVMSAAALGSILSASRLGKLADRIGHWPVIAGALAVAGLLLIPQAFVTSSWQLIVLRFLMGVALGGLLPCISAVIRHSVPDSAAGSILGLSVSSQYVGPGRRARSRRLRRRPYRHAGGVSRYLRAAGRGRGLFLAGAGRATPLPLTANKLDAGTRPGLPAPRESPAPRLTAMRTHDR